MNPTDFAEMLGCEPHMPAPRPWEPLREQTSDEAKQSGRRVFANRYYCVSVISSRDFGKMKCLMISNADQSARRDWREFQQIKNELCGPEWEAVELYPAESRKLDPSNAFLLYCWPTLPIRLGQYVRDVRTPGESIAPQRRFK